MSNNENKQDHTEDVGAFFAKDKRVPGRKHFPFPLSRLLREFFQRANSGDPAHMPSIAYTRAKALITKAIFRKPVIIESPFAGDRPSILARNIRYARFAVADSISRGEAPFASHLLYPQDNILSDLAPEERELGIVCGYTWMNQAEKVIFYTDLGMSPGMLMAREAALALDVDIEERTLPAFFPASPANPTSSRV